MWAEERAIVEFGFPGPRLLRYNHKDWEAINRSVSVGPHGDFAFRPVSAISIEALQRAVDLGYLVPDCIQGEMFDRNTNCVI